MDQSNKVGKKILLLIETSRTYGRQIIEGITKYALEKGSWTTFFEDRGPFLRETSLVRKFKFDGIISRTVGQQGRNLLRSLRVPTVELLDDGKNATSDIFCNDIQVGRHAAEHFRDRGFRHFAYFSTGSCWWSAGFCHEYERTVNRFGFQVAVSPFCRHRNDTAMAISLKKDMEEKIIDWLNDLPKPVGLFCPSDSQAIFVINLCQMAGIAIPHEIAVLGVENNLVLCNAVSPSLSSIAVNGRETGFQAAKLLDLKMQGKRIPKLPIRIAPGEIVTRRSTDIMAVDDPDVFQAIRLIKERATQRISVKEIADRLSISDRTLIRRFHELLGHSPEEELLRVRIEHAKLLLRETDLSVAIVAEKSGYSSLEYFNRAFYRKVGLSPRKFRELARLD